MSNDEFIPLNVNKIEQVEFKAIHQERSGRDRVVFYDLLEKSGIKKRKKNESIPELYSSGKDPYNHEEEKEKDFEEIKKKELDAIRDERNALNAEADSIREEARRSGFEEGKKEGYEEGLKEAREQTEKLQSMLNDMENLWKDQISANEDDIIKMILRISEKVIQGKVDSDNEIVKFSILHAFEQMPETREVTISVNPDDYEYIEVIQEDFFKKVEGLKQISILSDSSIGRGGCKIESRRGEVNSSIEGRLNAVKQSIIESHGG